MHSFPSAAIDGIAAQALVQMDGSEIEEAKSGESLLLLRFVLVGILYRKGTDRRNI